MCSKSVPSLRIVLMRLLTSRIALGWLIVISALLAGLNGSGQNLTLNAGDTTGCSLYQQFEPPVRIERTGAGDALHFPLDVDQDGMMDVDFIVANSFGALGMASNYIHIAPIDSAVVHYSRIDTSFCYYGFKPVSIAGLLQRGDSIQSQQNFTKVETIVEEEKWFLKDTCQVMIFDTGRYYLAVKLLDHGLKGLAWIEMDLFARNWNGFSADIRAIAYKSKTASVNEQGTTDAVVFPNPSDGKITISLRRPGRKTLVTVTDLTGGRILQYLQNETMTTWSLPGGIYLIRFNEQDRIPLVRKVVVY